MAFLTDTEIKYLEENEDRLSEIIHDPDPTKKLMLEKVISSRKIGQNGADKLIFLVSCLKYGEKGILVSVDFDCIRIYSKLDGFDEYLWIHIDESIKKFFLDDDTIIDKKRASSRIVSVLGSKYSYEFTQYVKKVLSGCIWENRLTGEWV